MMIRSSAVLLLLSLSISSSVNAQDFVYNANNANNVNSVNNFGGTSATTTTTTQNFPNTNGITFTNSAGNTYTNNNANVMPVDKVGTMNYPEEDPLATLDMLGEEDPFFAGAGNPFGGMDQTDDFASALGLYGGDMLTMMFGQCLNNLDLEKMFEDPFADVKNRCTDQQAVTFNSALDTFKTCAGFDLKELIEDLGSVYIGILLNCGSYAMSVSDELDEIGMGLEDMDKLKAKESPLPRVPQECVDALVGDNPFGTAFLYAEEFPEREQKCFSELAGKLPMCALSEWPVPIVGSWLSAFSCIYGNAQDVIMPLMQESIQSELGMLNDCLPQDISDASNCKEIRNKCIFDKDLPAMSMALPPPFWAPPMTQNYKDMADSTEEYGGNLWERYEAYRQTCVPPADLAIWDIAAGHKEKNKGVEGGASYYMEDTSEDENETKQEEAAAAPVDLGAAAAAATPPAAAASSSSSTKFMPGLLTGMIVAFAAMFGYNKYRNGGQMPIGNMGYQFNSLELSEGPVFS